MSIGPLVSILAQSDTMILPQDILQNFINDLESKGCELIRISRVDDSIEIIIRSKTEGSVKLIGRETDRGLKIS